MAILELSTLLQCRQDHQGITCEMGLFMTTPSKGIFLLLTVIRLGGVTHAAGFPSTATF